MYTNTEANPYQFIFVTCIRYQLHCQEAVQTFLFILTQVIKLPQVPQYVARFGKKSVVIQKSIGVTMTYIHDHSIFKPGACWLQLGFLELLLADVCMHVSLCVCSYVCVCVRPLGYSMNNQQHGVVWYRPNMIGQISSMALYGSCS